MRAGDLDRFEAEINKDFVVVPVNNEMVAGPKWDIYENNHFAIMFCYSYVQYVVRTYILHFESRRLFTLAVGQSGLIFCNIQNIFYVGQRENESHFQYKPKIF